MTFTGISKINQSLAALRNFVAIVAALWTMPVLSASVTIAWDPNPQPSVEGYVAYIRTAGSTTPQSFDVGTNTTHTFGNLTAGVSYVFEITAYNNDGIESAPAGNIQYTVPATSTTIETNTPSDTNVDGSASTNAIVSRITGIAASAQGATVSFTGTIGHAYTVERCTDLSKSEWVAVGTATVSEQGLGQFTDTTPAEAAFYRTVTQ